MESVGSRWGVANCIGWLFVVAVDTDGGTDGVIVFTVVVWMSSRSGSWR